MNVFPVNQQDLYICTKGLECNALVAQPGASYAGIGARPWYQKTKRTRPRVQISARAFFTFQDIDYFAEAGMRFAVLLHQL